MNKDLEAARYSLAHDGGTFDAVTGDLVEPTSGYAVGLPGGQRYLADAFSAADLEDAIRFSRVCNAAPYVGTWLDIDDRPTPSGDLECHCRWYIDPVVILSSLPDALAVARALRQRAVWDFEAGAAVAVTP